MEATAFPHRTPGFNLWVEPGEDGAQIAWARETCEALKPFMASGGYVNYLSGDEPQDRVGAAYGVNYERLRKVKRRFDPENLFRMNHNILPPNSPQGHCCKVRGLRDEPNAAIADGGG